MTGGWSIGGSPTIPRSGSGATRHAPYPRPIDDASLSPFGQRLRRWRRHRGLSQLDLAHAAGTSPRHVSFVETGRSRPGEALVLRLADALDVPLRERNDLLLAAGFSPVYAEPSLDAEAMAPFVRVIDLMLERHHPYPGFVLDRWWRIVRASPTAARMFQALAGIDLASPHEPVDFIDLFLADGPVTRAISNMDEVAWATVERVRAELAQAPDDERLHALLDRVETHARRFARPERPSGPVICPVLELGGQQIRTITAIARFGTPRTVTLDELQVELIYPADEAAAQFFAALADPPISDDRGAR